MHVSQEVSFAHEKLHRDDPQISVSCTVFIIYIYYLYYLPQTDDSIVKFRPFDNVETNWTCSICFDNVERTKFYNRIVRHCCRLWQQSRMLLRQSRTLVRHCCWCKRGLRLGGIVMCDGLSEREANRQRCSNESEEQRHCDEADGMRRQLIAEARRKEWSGLLTRTLSVVEIGRQEIKSECCEEVERRWGSTDMRAEWLWVMGSASYFLLFSCKRRPSASRNEAS